jgi:hypothetical protein
MANNDDDDDDDDDDDYGSNASRYLIVWITTTGVELMMHQFHGMRRNTMKGKATRTATFFSSVQGRCHVESLCVPRQPVGAVVYHTRTLEMRSFSSIRWVTS